jgi:hypothetical protein
VTGAVQTAGSGWTVAGVHITAADMSSIAPGDYDHDGTTESISDELTGLVGKSASLTYYAQPFKVVGFSS